MTRRPGRDPDQAGLFDVPDVPPVKPGRRLPTNPARVVWAKYRPVNPVKCDDCMHALAMAQGKAPASRQAKFKRTQGGEVLLVCYWHAQVRREEDGMSALDK